MQNYWLGHEEVRLSWHGIQIGKPDWAEYSHSIAVLLETEQGKGHVMVNAFWEDLVFELPPNVIWYRLIDTALPSPHDICDPKDTPLIQESVYHVKARSIAVVVSRS
jgi:isoamylase